MRIKNLVKVYVYSPDKTKKSGEYTTKWIYKDLFYLNKQQDVDEIDRNSAGEIDYEKIKLRTDKVLNIEKGDGISFNELSIDDNKIVTSGKPSYLVDEKPNIGKTTLYTLITNSGE